MSKINVIVNPSQYLLVQDVPYAENGLTEILAYCLYKQEQIGNNSDNSKTVAVDSETLSQPHQRLYIFLIDHSNCSIYSMISAHPYFPIIHTLQIRSCC